MLEKNARNMSTSDGGENVPRFLIIGGMKCGSTTVYNDLRKHSRIKFPGKETSFFSDPSSDDGQSQVAYKNKFNRSYLWGDCSTRYAMIPTYTGVAERAKRMLGADIKIIYMVRNPIERSISHHHHLQAREATRLNFESAIEQIPEIIEYSRYDIQVEPWLEKFGADAIRVIPIEDYNSNWRFNIDALAAHIGVDAREFQGDVAEHANKTNEARVLKGVYKRVYDSKMFGMVYRDGIKVVLPEGMRQKFRNLVLPKPPLRESAPSKEVLQSFINKLTPAVSAVKQLNQRCDWDLADTVRRLAGDH